MERYRDDYICVTCMYMYQVYIQAKYVLICAVFLAEVELIFDEGMSELSRVSD